MIGNSEQTKSLSLDTRLLCGIWDLGGGVRPDLGGCFQAKKFRAVLNLFILVAKYMIVSGETMHFKRNHDFEQNIGIIKRKIIVVSEK